MSEVPSAAVIPFPRANQAAAAAEQPERLSRALAELGAALAAQRGAVSDWRVSLASLHGAVGALGESLLDYRAELAALDGRLGRLREEAHRLERLANTGQATSAPSRPRFGGGGPGSTFAR